MTTSRILLEIAKTKSSDYKDIDKYTSVYHAAYYQICGLTIEDLDLSIKEASMFLNMSNKYSGIMSIIELEWKN